MPRPSNLLRGLALAALIAALSGCSEYLDRREGISLNSGDAVMTNRVTQMVDPWPRVSADKNIAFNGEKMQSAVQRYRTNRVIEPQGIGTSGSYASQGATNSNNATPVGPTVTQSAAPVK